MSNYIYHGVPKHMVGTKLIPLNEMPETMQSHRKKYLEKYQGREEILERKMPLLNCLWNDVVQFLPTHPREVFAKQVEMGIIPEIPPYRFYEIDIEQLEETKAVVFFKTAPGDENSYLKWLKDVDLTKLQGIPEETINYYGTVVETGELPFNYQFIPHLLYKGVVDISNSKIITL